MLKPNDYDKVAASLAFEPLALGGHVCVIKGVEEAKSSTGKDMLKVALDIADGDPQAGYYAEKFANDDRPNKKWPCIMYVVTTDNAGHCSRQLAGFVTSVEESMGSGWSFPWDKTSLLKGAKVGCVFGHEEYQNDKGEIKKSIKPFWFCSAERAKDAKVPKLKEYKAAQSSANVSSAGWADLSSDDIPF